MLRTVAPGTQLLAALPVMTYVLRVPAGLPFPVGTVLTPGSRLADHLGCDERDVEATTLLATTVHPDDREGWATEVRLAAAGLTGATHTYRLRRADGDFWPVEDRSEVAWVDDDGTQVRVGVVRDITAERAAAERSADLEQLLTQVWQTPVALYRYVDGAGFTYMTHPVSGWPQETYLSDPGFWRAIVHPDDQARVAAAEDESIRTRSRFDVTYRARRPDGSWMWLLDQADPVDVAESGGLVWIGQSIDVTDLVVAREDRRRAELRLARLVDTLDLDPYEFTADATARPLAVPPLSAGSHVHPEDEQRVRAALAHALASGDDFREEYRVVAADGTVRWCLDHATPVGEPGVWGGIRTDVTALREAQRENRRSLAFLQQLMAKIPGEVNSYDESGFTFVSPPSWSGQRPEQYYRDPNFWKQTVHPADRDRVVREVAVAEAAGEAYAVEYRYVDPLRSRDDASASIDGPRWVLDTAQPFDDPQTGERTWFGISVDVTDEHRQRAENDRIRTALSRRELEVFRLLGEGLGNAAIADRLVLSLRTVHHHVASVLAKLGLANRAQAAALASRLSTRLAD